MNAAVKTIEWVGGPDGWLRILDQTCLPTEVVFRDCQSVEDVFEAIRSLRVRGAPAIGIAAAYGVVLGVGNAGPAEMQGQVENACCMLAASRPTAVNLFAALERMKRQAAALAGDELAGGSVFRERLLAEAHAMHREDAARCRAIAEHGLSLIRDGMCLLTHCNAGALASAEWGTALAPIFLAAARGLGIHVYVCETRPLLQGARLTAWELSQRGISCTLITDSMAAQVMKAGRVQAVLVGADRIAANGDTANKIGTYGLALLAKAHEIPFYVAAPSTTFDANLPCGDQMLIEHRAADEITHFRGHRLAPAGVAVFNPAFDVTPAGLIRALITEAGIIQPVHAASIRALLPW